MAKQNIGFENNPAGSAVALAIGGALKNYLLKHTSGKANIAVSKVSVKSLGKALFYANVANAANETLADFLPHVNAAVTWVGALPANVLNQTLGRIPVLGKIFRFLHNLATDAVSTIADAVGLDAIAATGRTLRLQDPDKGFETEIEWKSGKTGQTDLIEEEDGGKTMKNDPGFYTNLDLHKEFSIPGAYTKKTVVNGTMGTPTIVVHRITENPVPSASALRDRLNQKFTLIKAVRGLSATRYDLLDLANYERFAKYNLFLYYTLKKVVQAAKTYALIQTKIGDAIIDSLGFDSAEVRTNLAQYESLLCQIHRFITNNIPVSGTWVKRLEYLIAANVPDYTNQAVATIHMFSMCMRAVFTRREPDEQGQYGELVFDCIPGASNNNYSTMMNNFNVAQQVIVNSDIWQQLIADYFGAFGAKAMWEDKDYPAYAKPLNLRLCDNDLSREQIKNALYAGGKFEVITINAGVQNRKLNIEVDSLAPGHLSNYVFGVTPYTGQSWAGLNYTNLLDADSYLSSQLSVSVTMGTTNKVLLPDMNGCGAQEVNLVMDTNNIVDMQNHETIYTLHKDKYNEGEALEISQFKSRSIGWKFYPQDSADMMNASCYFKTHEYAVQESVAYTFANTGSDIQLLKYYITNEAISDDDLQDVESPVDFPDEIMCWCLIDWMPLAHFTFFGYNSSQSKYSPRDIAAVDMDSFGSLDDRAFDTSINYSVYSLQAASLVVNKDSKRVSNLGDVYRDKPSKRG